MDHFLVLAFTPRVTVIKISQLAQFLYFLLMTAKMRQFAQFIYVYLKVLNEFFQKILWLLELPFVRLSVEISEKLLRQQKIPKSCIFKG